MTSRLLSLLTSGCDRPGVPPSAALLPLTVTSDLCKVLCTHRKSDSLIISRKQQRPVAQGWGNWADTGEMGCVEHRETCWRVGWRALKQARPLLRLARYLFLLCYTGTSSCSVSRSGQQTLKESGGWNPAIDWTRVDVNQEVPSQEG